MNVEEEVQRLRQEIMRLGKVQEDGSYKVFITKSHLSIFFLYHVAMNHIYGTSSSQFLHHLFLIHA